MPFDWLMVWIHFQQRNTKLLGFWPMSQINQLLATFLLWTNNSNVVAIRLVGIQFQQRNLKLLAICSCYVLCMYALCNAFDLISHIAYTALEHVAKASKCWLQTAVPKLKLYNIRKRELLRTLLLSTYSVCNAFDFSYEPTYSHLLTWWYIFWYMLTFH